MLRIAEEVRAGALDVMRPGESDLSGRELLRVGRVAVAATIVTVNLVGACAVLAIAAFVVPLPLPPNVAHVRLVNAIAAAIYVAFAVPVGIALGMRGLQRLRQWLVEDRPASPEEIRIVLRAPARLFAVQVGMWFGAVVVFWILNSRYPGADAQRIAVIIAITGLVTAACAYLLTDLLLRPAAARALACGTPERLVVPGVATRAILAWALGTGLPVLGIVAIGIAALGGDSSATVSSLGKAMVALGGIGLTVGLLATTVAARATADPVDSVRRALREVQRGDFDVRVPVYDGTQIGQLQLGFNAMVSGLAERERIRETFGTYVDPGVAEHILEEGTKLAGEEVEVTLMFIDVRNFTGFAERTAADQVVAAINEVFEQIVPIIHAHGGRVDKFVGDGLLAVFGAPRRARDHAGQALSAALEIVAAVHSSHGLELGLGLNSGTVVAGNVGGGGRFEFSVIGDAVNVAARVEAATRQTGDAILVAERTREQLGETGAKLVERPGVELKGKREAVRLFAVDGQPARSGA